MKDLPKRKRRWYQFSLRALFVIVLLVSVGMSWLAVKLETARRQREAVEAIRKAGGDIIYDHPSYDPFVQPPVPKRPPEEDLFDDLREVFVKAKSFGDNDAVYLKELTSLRRAHLRQTQITDAGLKHLGGLTNLAHLDLACTNITDAGLEGLKGMANLKGLVLGGTEVTDTGLEHLKGMTTLRHLYLDETQVTAEGVKRLREALPECEIQY